MLNILKQEGQVALFKANEGILKQKSSWGTTFELLSLKNIWKTLPGMINLEKQKTLIVRAFVSGL